MKAAELLIRCLENEGVLVLFGIPGEENIDIMDAILDSSLRFITTRHEQGAAFMADICGRLTGRAGVCLATLGPGATNLATGVADANMDRAPLVAIAGQAATTRMHKESHQHLDLVNLFRPITKYSVQVRAAGIIPEVVRKAFKQSEAEKPGASFIDLPENIARANVEQEEPLTRQSAMPPQPPGDKVKEAAAIISRAQYPIIMAGNGVIRAGASESLRRFAESLNIPAATTFMAKGAIPFSHPLALGAVGLHAHDYVACGFDRADVIICVGYDMVEYPPHLWHPDRHRRIIHIDAFPAEVDAHYVVATGVIGHPGRALDAIAREASPRENAAPVGLRQTILDEFSRHAGDQSFPVKPQKIVWDLRRVLEPQDIVICDVGAHKMWMARMYQAEQPNTCIISNGFACMGIGVPGAIGAKLTYPDRTVVAVTGDGGFLMNAQEIETALRIGTSIVILVWTDSEYGLIRLHQQRLLGRPSHIAFKNPDLVKFAESFGARGYRVEAATDLDAILRQAIADDTVVVIDCPVDYSENMKLTRSLGNLVCSI
ncbi:MAG: acetolactate synthase large subunit [Acidobacteriota bacterium]